jgi:hypothetical protein
MERTRRVLIPVVVTAAAAWLARVGYRGAWTGFTDKKLWDWLHLLVIPTVLGATVLWFNYTQGKSEKEIASERTQEESLQGYLDRMTELLLREGLRNSQPDSEVRDVARARTLTVLRRLDGERKGILVRFLRESELIVQQDAAEPPGAVVDLRGADLQGARLSNASLTLADLRDVDLSGAELWFANLQGANLEGANLSGAELWFANLQGANLEGANLTEAELTGVVLHQANLRGANLKLADLEGADLRYADLEGALVTEAQLAQARYVAGATMPDGTHHQ